MNQNTKNALTISAVVVCHLAVVTLMLVQPGCSSSSQKSAAPEPAESANATVTPTTTAVTPAPAEPALSEPTRPPEEETITPVKVAQLDAGAEPLSSNAVNATPAASTTPPPVVTYVVKEKDNLTKIARATGSTISAIKAANNLKSDVLRVGQELTIPTPSSETASAASTAANTTASGEDAGTYKVVAGDNLTIIARKNGVKVSDLKAANDLKSDVIHVGQVLKLPASASGAAAAATSAAPASAASASAAPAESSDTGEYVVVSGDSLATIARKFHVRVSDLMKLNNISEQQARNLRIGQKLQLPASAAPATAPATSMTSAPAAPNPAAPSSAAVQAAPDLSSPAPAATPTPTTSAPVQPMPDTPPVAPVSN